MVISVLWMGSCGREGGERIDGWVGRDGGGWVGGLD